MTNTKKTILNFVISIGSQLIILVMGLVIPRIVLIHYGSDTNGLISTITQIFTYMALLEAGISASAKNALYKPIKENDRKGISFYMSAAQRYYRKISVIYFIGIVVLSVLIPFVLKTEVNYLTIMFYTFFEGLTSVVSFYFINTWTCFLGASGKNYIVITISLLTKILCNTVRIVLSLFNINIAFIQIGYFVVSLITLFIYRTYMRRQYGWIDYSAASKDVKLVDRNAYVVTEIAWTVFSSTDMIVLSIFVSTSLSSVYSIYNMVFVAINGLLNAAYSAIYYNLGHAYVEGGEQYKKMHDIFHSFFLAAMTILMCVTYLLIIPFIRLYTTGITDINYIYKWLPLLFCLIQMLSWSRYIAGNLSGVAGYAKQTSYVSLIEAIINIILSIILVNFFGITGVLLATVLALPLKVIYLNWLAEKKIMKRSPLKTLLTIGVNYSIFILTVIIAPLLEFRIDKYSIFFLYGFILLIVYVIIVFGANCIINRDLMRMPKFFLKHNR